MLGSISAIAITNDYPIIDNDERISIYNVNNDNFDNSENNKALLVVKVVAMILTTKIDYTG